jgi:basic membrane protein A
VNISRRAWRGANGKAGIASAGRVAPAAASASAKPRASTVAPALAFALAFASALVAAGCSSDINSEAAGCDDPETFCIGLALESGVVDDGAFNAAAWQGVQEAAAATGGIAEYLEASDASSYAANLDDFGARGFDVVVATGVGQPEATIAAAEAHPGTRYIGLSQDMSDGPANTTGLIFRDDEAGYAAGFLAGLMTKSGTVGAVLGSESVVPLKRFGEGYRLGALAARPDATVIMSYNNESADSFNDPAWGAKATNELIDRGADVVFGAGGTTGIAALETVASAPGAGVSLFCIGIDVDQYETVPKARPCLLSSAEKKIGRGVSELIAQIHAGGVGGAAGGAAGRNVEGAIGLAPYHDVASQVPDAVKRQVDAVVAGLIDGSINTGVDF